VLACLAAGAEVLGLMNQVVSDQRWGLGAAGVDAQFKGGWGPGSEPGVNGSYLDRQVCVTTPTPTAPTYYTVQFRVKRIGCP
jgi:hypothetical protein